MMKLIAGVDIGNASTEVAIAQVTEKNSLYFSSAELFKHLELKGLGKIFTGSLPV